MMFVMTDAEIAEALQGGFHQSGRSARRRLKSREYRRDESQYEHYADDWEREGDD